MKRIMKMIKTVRMYFLTALIKWDYERIRKADRKLEELTQKLQPRLVERSKRRDRLLAEIKGGPK